jgi:hypothetical protein
MPSLGLIVVAGILLAYRRRVTVDLQGGGVQSRETILGLPLRTDTWRVEQFDSVRAHLQSPGRENKPGSYYTICLVRHRETVPLFDVDDLGEARQLARGLADRLGLASR